MAIINCPNCAKKTTELSDRCPHCGFVRGVEKDERQQELMRRKLRDHVYHLKMTSYAVITVFLAAFGWYWWDTSWFQQQPSLAPLLLVGLTTIAYLAIRVLLFRARRSLKKLSRW
jgi:hypothetical protein